MFHEVTVFFLPLKSEPDVLTGKLELYGIYDIGLCGLCRVSKSRSTFRSTARIFSHKYQVYAYITKDRVHIYLGTFLHRHVSMCSLATFLRNVAFKI